jgi:hypothetical protein
MISPQFGMSYQVTGDPKRRFDLQEKMQGIYEKFWAHSVKPDGNFLRRALVPIDIFGDDKYLYALGDDAIAAHTLRMMRQDHPEFEPVEKAFWQKMDAQRINITI